MVYFRSLRVNPRRLLVFLFNLVRMDFHAFVALWQHRYRKYTYLLTQCWGAACDVAYFAGLKYLRLCGRRSLVMVIRTEHFGDIVAAEPIVAQIEEKYKNTYIIWAVKPVFKLLVEYHPSIHETWLQTSVFRRILVCQSGVFDHIINLEFWQSNQDTVTGHVHSNPEAIAQNITIFNYLKKGNLLTIFQLLAKLPVADATPRLFIPAADAAVVQALHLPKRRVVFHCSSNYPAKDWQVAHWGKLADFFIKNGYHVVEIGLKSHNQISAPQYHNLCGQLSILQTAEVIRGAAFFVGIDSGPAHLANAVGTYGILLFGKLGGFDRYQIYSGRYLSPDHATVIQQKGKTCAELDYEEVEEICAKLLTKNGTMISRSES
jgi:heptosyltransferase III